MSAIQEIERRLLALPIKQRAFLAESLLDSLPPIGHAMSEAEEMAEVERRDMEIESGVVLPLTDAEFWRSVEADSD
jgi:hypothetical protein